MKEIPNEHALRLRLGPGVLSSEGFLGHDERAIATIVADDQARLEAAGLSIPEAADILERVVTAAEAALETPVKLFGGHVTAQLVEAMGRLPCPFACGFRAHKGIVTITVEGDIWQFTPLAAHLLRAHGFLQGVGSPYRLDPDRLITLVRLSRP